MGKFLRSCKPPPQPRAPAAEYLTLRSGRRVPSAAGPRRRRPHHRRCAKNASTRRPQDADEVTSRSNYSVICEESCEERQVTSHSSNLRHSDDGATTAPPEAEIEAFFAAAELALRRRFAETYNYDIGLDRPLEGRFEWAPAST